MLLINDSLKSCIKDYRELKFSNLDLINREIISLFQEIKEVSYFEDLKRDQIVFSLPLNAINTKIEYTSNFTMRQLLNLNLMNNSLEFKNDLVDILHQMSKTNIKFDLNRLKY